MPPTPSADMPSGPPTANAALPPISERGRIGVRIVGKRQSCSTAECKGTLVDRNRLPETTKTLYEGTVRAPHCH
jgi:hypothetical protein